MKSQCGYVEVMKLQFKNKSNTQLHYTIRRAASILLKQPKFQTLSKKIFARKLSNLGGVQNKLKQFKQITNESLWAWPPTTMQFL